MEGKGDESDSEVTDGSISDEPATQAPQNSRNSEIEKVDYMDIENDGRVEDMDTGAANSSGSVAELHGEGRTIIELMSDSDTDMSSDEGDQHPQNPPALDSYISAKRHDHDSKTSPSSSSSSSKYTSPSSSTSSSSLTSSTVVPAIPVPSQSTFSSQSTTISPAGSSPSDAAHPSSQARPRSDAKKNIVQESLTAIYDLCIFTQDTFDYATYLVNNARYSSLPFTSALPQNVEVTAMERALKNPFPGATTLGDFWGTYLKKFCEIFSRLSEIENHDAGESMIFGGVDDAPFCVFMIIHNLNILGEVIVKSVGLVSEQTTSQPALGGFSAMLFWEKVLGTFEVLDGHNVTIANDGLLRDISSVVSRSLLHFRFFLDSEVQNQVQPTLHASNPPRPEDASHKFVTHQLDNILATSFALHSLNRLCNNIYMDTETALSEALANKEAARKELVASFPGLANSGSDTEASTHICSSPNRKRKTRNMEREEQDLSSINTRDPIHVKYFGDSQDFFCHETCSYCMNSKQITICACGSCACSNNTSSCLLNGYRTHGDLISSGRVDLHTCDKLTDEYFCPTCDAGRKLAKAVEQQERLEINRLLVYEFANPHFASTLNQSHTLSPIHTAACQNSYEILSMLLFGASVLIKVSGEIGGDLLPESLPARAWGRDHNKKTPFETAYDMSLKSAVEDKGSVCSPPCTESVLLLAMRGCGDVKKVDELSTRRIHLMNMVSQGGTPVDGPIHYPRNDISMGSERFKLPWVNDTGDGALLTPSDLHYIRCCVETRHAAIAWHHSITSTLSGGVTQKGSKQVKRRNNQLIRPWQSKPGTSDGPCTEDNRQDRLQSAHKSNGHTPNIERCMLECNFLCPCHRDALRLANPLIGGSLGMQPCQNVKSEGLQFPLEVFRTPDNRGWAARTQRGVTIPKGAIVCPYSGQLADEIQVKGLEEMYAQMDKGSFIMNLHEAKLKGEAPPGEYFVNDATIYRNVGAFFNHTCEKPNVKFKFSYRNHLDYRFPTVLFVAVENIPPLTELCFNYGEKVEGLCNSCGKKHCLCAGCMNKKFASCKR